MAGYTTREVADAVGLTPAQVRSYARSGLLDPARGPRNAYRFSFQDVVLLRTARELRDRDVPPRRIRAALRSLSDQLPAGRPLSAVSIAAAGDRVVVRDRDTTWEPETGQVTLDFSVGELAARVEPFARRVTREVRGGGGLDADDWYDLGVDLEAVSDQEAEEAYRQTLELDPAHTEALVNLGRLLHDRGRLKLAEEQYRRALELEPDHALAAFNLGVVLEDRGREEPARGAYRKALEADPDLAEAHFNLARLLEKAGEESAAIKHLATYKRLRGRQA